MADLSQIHHPADLRGLSMEECVELADDIRTKIIQTVSRNGGHLSSNLGIVEITMALHRAFETPRDKLIFDVGHQAYVHKLLTGRYEQFDTLRSFGGLSGFPKYGESEHDCFETGHASTAISAALGMARARDVLKESHHVVAVVGDGALTGGMCYEALNDCGNDDPKTRLIVILNDNEMSIAKNVGALSKHLSELRASSSWNTTKQRVKTTLQKLPAIGLPIQNLIHHVKKSIKSFLVDEGFFSALGWHYIGPIDGHNLASLEKIFEQAKQFEEPVVIHCATKKGYGYYRAERKPEVFHGTPPFLIENGKAQKADSTLNGRVAVDTLLELAKEDPRIVVLTAAMPLGTCTDHFQPAYPDRFFDVGIAEEHAVTLAGGMGKSGLRPFLFLYSTFLQRGYDQVMHDVCMQDAPVTLMLDRAGLSNEDGKSHQGLFDIAFLRNIPGITLLAPADETELREMVRAAHALNAPCVIRYPKNAVHLPEPYLLEPFQVGRWQTLRPGRSGAVLAVGTMVPSALKVADALAAQGIELEVINASTVKPLDGECLRRLSREGMVCWTLEEHVLSGGFGSAVLEWAALEQTALAVHPIGVKEQFVPHGDHQSLLKYVGLDEETIARSILAEFQGRAAGDAAHE